MTAQFSHLFSPGRIGMLNLRNRLIMSLFPTKYATDSKVNDRLVEFFRTRARGGVALIVLDGCCLDYPRAYKGPAELRMDTDEHVAGLKRLLFAVQNEGARAFMHLNYPSALPVVAGTTGAVQKKGKWVLSLVNQAAADELARIAGLFGAGAARARQIGYDGVEVQASWGDLISQFLSPLTNQRTDAYGGTLDHRCRFLLEVVRAIKKAAGVDFPLQIKFVADELCPGGFGLGESEIVARRLEEAGVDSVLTNVGNKKTKSHALPAHSLPHGVSAHYAAALKSVIKIPVSAMGKISSPELAEQLLAEGSVDMVAMTRALITDPELPNKAKRGEVEDIRGCIYCLDDCSDKGVPGIGRACVNNPMAGQEAELVIRKAAQPKEIWVIGGGPAGMQAALTAAERGHYVRLFERLGHLGGQFRLAPLTPYKAEVSEVLRWLELQIEKARVDIELNHPVTVDEIIRAKPNVVIMATGSEPKVPLIHGIDRPGVYSARQFLEGRVTAGATTVVIGAGELGCEIAELAADQGSRVTVVEMLDEALAKAKSMPRADLLKRLAEKNIQILTRTGVSSIKDSVIAATGSDGKELQLPAETVIYAVGNNSTRQLYHGLLGQIAEVYLVGDAEEPGNVGHALRTALKVASTI